MHRFLSTESYWAKDRSRELVEELVRTSARVVGPYDGERQVGFARVVSDRHVVADLAGVWRKGMQ